MPPPIHVTFTAGHTGNWRIDRVSAICGEGLPRADRLSIAEGIENEPDVDAAWRLRSATSNIRYTFREELSALAARQAGLARPSATHAALIPIRKTAAWWELAQDERRAIFEEQSRHIGIGMAYLPAIARRLHHCRELGEPFDFLTWFEFAPQDEPAFDAMLLELRKTPEWRYVDREVDVRLSRIEPT